MNGNKVVTASGMMICPTCQGSMAVKGRTCRVCRGSGVLTKDGEFVSYEEELEFYDWWEEQNRQKRRMV